MLSDECSRRQFLKKFAMLSAASLSLSAVTLACYGPSPNTPSISPQVSTMYFKDAQSNNVSLYGNQNVPVHTTFIIVFSTAMNTTGPSTVIFTDSNSNPVAFDKVWDNNAPSSLMVTPQADLSLDSVYTLKMGGDAVDTFGNTMTLTDSATAIFKTVAA